MISRRNFLKIAGLSSVALGTGFTAGKLVGNKKSVYFAVHGYIPADEQVIANLVTAFKNKVQSNSEAVVIADSKVGEIINRFDLKSRKENFSNSGTITYRLKRQNEQVDSDIIVSDADNSVYSLNNLNSSFANVRAGLKNRKADLLFTAEYKETDLLTSLFSSENREVVIENEKGLVDRISLDSNYKNIFIEGPQGKTGLKIENGIARVHTSTCRHGICKHSVASGVGNIIACAPNKVLIKIV
ncbi:MAG: NusG domain II-containing protein [Ignavibacterium sp.]|nr:NusG domain II-containing protein [Ignavibacterium sp.]